MTIRDSETLKSYFNLRKVPTPSNYDDLIDTLFEKSIVGNISTEHINITNTAIQLKDGDTIYTELAGGSLTLGLITKDHILVASSGIQLKEDTVVKIDLQADGDVFIGEDVSAAPTTFMSIFSNSQIYNGELISAGDVLLGDNSLSKANILWDKSTGKLLFRGGTTMQAEIGTSGAILAGGGFLVLDSNGVRLISDSATYSTHQSVIWKDNTDTYVIGKVETQYNPTIHQVELELEAHAQSSYDNRITFYSHNNMYDGVAILLEASGTTAVDAYIDMRIDAVSKFACYNTYNLSWQDLRISTGLVAGSSATDPGAGEIIATNRIYINETSNVKSTQGLTINQGSNDDEILAFKSSDIAHGMSDITETDTYGFIQKNNASYGALKIVGLQSNSAPSVILAGYGATGVNDKSTTGLAEVIVYAAKKNGTNIQALGNDENILAIRNYSDAYFFFDASANFTYHGALQSYKNSTIYKGYIFVPLLSKLTSTSWDGDAYSTTSKTLIDLSAVFGVPAGVKAVQIVVAIRDSGSNGTDCYILFGPNNTAAEGSSVDCHTINDRWSRECLIVPCDANGDIYYQISASGSSTMDVYVEIWGYWI